MVDYVQYTFNLTEANILSSNNNNNTPNWYEQYKFLKEYNMDEITEKTMGQLFKNLTANEILATTYFK